MRLDAHQNAARPQGLPRTPEDMDHALERDSSEGPAEQRDIERLHAHRHPFPGGHLERSVADALDSVDPPSSSD